MGATDAATRRPLPSAGRAAGSQTIGVLSGFGDEKELSRAGADLLLEPAQETMRKRAFAQLGDKVQVQTTSFNGDSGVVGAVALALNAFFFQPAEGAG